MKKKSLLILLAALLCVANMWASVNADDYKLPGAFSVSSTKVVYFSQGNLQYTKSTGTWSFMEEQYSTVETSFQNVGTDYANQDVVTLFGWGTSGWDNTAADATSVHYQPYSTCGANHSTTNNNYQYGPSLANVAAGESWSKEVAGNHPYENYDWGVFNSGDLGAGWRTLTKDEWVYLFNTRTPGNSVNGVSNARYTEATINTDGTAVNGIILFPDDAVLTSVSGVTWGTINSGSSWGTRCTTTGWTALETAGCVFLPAAGNRNGAKVYNVGSYGYYWSSSAYSAASAYYLGFRGVNPQNGYTRCAGCSVRLVSETAPKTPASVTAAPTAKNLTYTGNAQALVNAGTASGGTLNYSLDNTNWSEDIPTGTNAGDYTVYYMVVGDDSHADYTPDNNSVAVTIAPFTLTIQPVGGASFTVNTVQTATVYEVKQLIEAEISIAPEYQRLIFAGKQLENGRTLSEYNITNGTTVNLIYRITIDINANEDPNHAGDFYATFFDSSKKYTLPNDGTEAYAAEVSGDALYLHKIAENDDVLPANTAVIFKATSSTITLTESVEDAVSFSATNNLHGVDADTEIASVVSGTCYVLSGGENGVGFYLYEAPNQLKAHKAYIDWNAGSSMAQAPRRLRFVYDQATGIENGQMTNDERQTTKLLRDGQLIIIRNGVEYNVNGQMIK